MIERIYIPVPNSLHQDSASATLQSPNQCIANILGSSTEAKKEADDGTQGDEEHVQVIRGLIKQEDVRVHQRHEQHHHLGGVGEMWCFGAGGGGVRLLVCPLQVLPR